MVHHPFPAEFVWGVATSAYQIEGASAEGGRGESIWEHFARRPGAISDQSDGSRACDHYHRFREDVQVMGRLGVKAYRFSVAWPRVLPTGRGLPNPAGLDFYDLLVDTLLDAGIEPYLTLNHWDLPQALEDEGGWAERGTVDAFVRYAEAVAYRLGDRVRHWVTHNEPWCIATLGYETGEHAPGRRDPAAALRAAHHLLLSHGRAVPALRTFARGAEVGIVLNLVPAHAASPSEADQQAARSFDGSFNRWYLDPLFRGRYPEDAVADRVARGHLAPGPLPFVQPGDLAHIGTPIDFLGVNYYSRAILRSDAVPEAQNAPRSIPAPAPEAMTDMGWEVYPDGLRETLLRVQRDYAPLRLYVTENGCAYADGPDAGGRVADVRRIDYLRGHLAACSQAIAGGVPLAGYFLWSLLDNFEWQFGYTRRFGAVWVDFETQQRLPKDSALWYRDAIAANAVTDGELHQRSA